MAGDEQDLGMGGMRGGGGFFSRMKRRTTVGTLAAKVNVEGVKSLTREFGGLLKVLKDVRSELEGINKAATTAGSAGRTGGTGQGTSTGAAGTGAAGQIASNIVGVVAPPTASAPAGGQTAAGQAAPAASSVRGPGGFNFGSTTGWSRVGSVANAIGTGLNVLESRTQRNVLQSAPISSQDVATAAMYGPGTYQGMEMRRYGSAGPYAGSRENVQAAQQVALGFGAVGTQGPRGSNAALGQFGTMVQAYGGSIDISQAAASTGLFAAPAVSNRARALGIATYRNQGVLANPMKVALDYVRDYEKRSGITLNEIDFANFQNPSSAGRMRMKQIYNLSDEAIDMVITAGMENMQFGKKTGGRQIDFNKGADLEKIGLSNKSLGLQAARFGTATQRREARYFQQTESAQVNRLGTEITIQDKLSGLEDAFSGVLGTLHEFDRVLKIVTTALGGIAAIGMLGRLTGGGGGGGGIFGGLAQLLGRGGGGGATAAVEGAATQAAVGAEAAAGGVAPAAAGAAGMGTMGALGLGAAGAGIGIMGMRTAGSARTPGGAALGIAETTAGGAMVGFAVGGPVGAAIGGTVGAVAGTAFAAKNYFKAVDKRKVAEGYDVGVGLKDKDLIESLGAYRENERKNKEVDLGLKGEGAGSKERGKYDAFAQRRGSLLAAALDEAQKTQGSGLDKLNTRDSSELADLVIFFSSEGVFNDDQLFRNRDKAKKWVDKINTGKIWRKYFGQSVQDPFAFQPVTTDQAESLVSTGGEVYSEKLAAAGIDTGGAAKQGDGPFALSDDGTDMSNQRLRSMAGRDPFPGGGDPVSDRAEGMGETWQKLDPRMKDRLLKMFRASGGRVWLGGGWRSTEAQRAMFLSRYVIDDANGSISWEGHKWRHARGAPAAPPGRSMHEIGMAADLAGDTGWVGQHGGEFGLKDFSDVNGEPWHVQLVEFPNGRSEYERTGDTPGGGGETPGDSGTAPPQSGGFSGSVGSSSGIGYSIAAAAQAVSAPGMSYAPTAAAGPGTGGGGGGGGGGPGIDGAVQAAHSAGFTGEGLIKIVAIAGRESHFDPLAHRTDTGRPDDWTVGDRGMWQINYVNDPGLRRAGIIRTADDLKSAVTNAKAAFLLSGGGTSFSPWNAGPGGFIGSGNPLFGTDVDAARAAVQKAGFGDAVFDPGMLAPAPMSAGSANVSITVNITSTGNVQYDAQALGEAVRPVLTNVMAEIHAKRGS